MEKIEINIVKLKKYALNCSVLYVEDDEVIRTATASFLGRFFHDIVLAEDGALGLETYKHREFDIVITDINMPNMNGIEMIEAIKEIWYEQPIIVTSAYNDSENLMKLIELDVNRFVQKPFNNKHFLYVLYKIAEELNFINESEEREAENAKNAQRAQKIVDHLDVGIIVFKDNKIEMANEAFLNIGGFNNFDELLLEMPDIGVLFEPVSNCISVATNEELIKKLLSVDDNESKVRILQDAKTIEYRVSISSLDEEDSYIVSFTDITAIHNAMYMDEHTKLPARKFTFEKIEIFKQQRNSLKIILIGIQHYSQVVRDYGKKTGISLQKELASELKEIKEKLMPTAFLGNMNENMFVFIPTPEKNSVVLRKALQEIKLNSELLLAQTVSMKKDFKLLINLKEEELDLTKELSELEVDMIQIFEDMK